MIEQIKQEMKKAFEKSKGSHDLDHTLRVYNLAVKIAEKEGANLEIIKLAALLHDIARPEQDKSQGKICHAELGKEKAKLILEKYQIDPKKIEQIIHCIATHRFRKSNQPETKEAKVLFDADKLDSIGAIGIGRAFLFAGEVGAKLHNEKGVDIEKTKEYSPEDTAFREFAVKLRKVKDRLYTNTGKQIAESRHNYMENFFQRLDDEIDGKL